jgi:hypothetical protein
MINNEEKLENTFERERKERTCKETIFQLVFWKHLQDPRPSTKATNFDVEYPHSHPTTITRFLEKK